MYVIEAQLALLLRLSEAGGPGHRRSSAKALLDVSVIPYLSSCKALDFEPEDPATIQRGKANSLRYRMFHLVAPVLRLVLGLAGTFSSSEVVRADAAAFVEAHTELLRRLLREAASPGAQQGMQTCSVQHVHVLV